MAPTASPDLISFPAHALLILEERLKEHQADGSLEPNADITCLAVAILLISAGSLVGERSFTLETGGSM
jgi:hypothetical protein